LNKYVLSLAIAASILIASCRPKVANVEKRVENGVEVIINRVTPDTARNLRSPLRLDEIFNIDTENADIARLGTSDIWGFDVNSAGEIFVFKSPLNQGDLIYRFDPAGRFLSSFGRKGEGPGELQMPIFQKLSASGELAIPDAGKRKIFVFDREGRLLREIPIKPRLRQTSERLLPLDDTRFLYRRVDFDTAHPVAKISYVFSIVDRECSEIKELDRIPVENTDSVAKVLYPFPFIRWALSGDRIFLVNDERGYEIRAYDFDGKLVRRIGKEGPPVKFPEAMRRDVLKNIEAPTFAFLKTKIKFADPAPPCQHIWVDDKGRLYVKTYEEGVRPGEFMIDIFDGGGVFIGQASMNIHAGMDLFGQAPRLDSWTTMKNDRFYCLREKDSGYLQLVVYRVNWVN
jgi:hypothetical protein